MESLETKGLDYRINRRLTHLPTTGESKNMTNGYTANIKPVVVEPTPFFAP